MMLLVSSASWSDPLAPSSGSYTVTDRLNRTVHFERPAHRLVYLNYFEAIPALKLWDRVVGISRFGYHSDILQATHPHLHTVPSPGSGADIHIEKLLALQPDAVITWAAHPELVTFMADKGLKVVAFQPRSIAEVYHDLRVQAGIAGTPDAAESVIAAMTQLIAQVQERVKPITAPKTVVWLWGKPTQIAGGEGVSNDLLSKINVINPGDQLGTTNPDVGLERMVRFNPDVILIWAYAKYEAADLLNNPQWRTVSAIKQRQVFKAPITGTWGPRVAPLLLWAAAQVYPERFADLDIAAEIQRFDRAVFGVTLP